jgi:hypothetical protein
MKRGTIAAIAALSVAVAGAGCGGEEEETPAACVGDARDYLAALEAAPGDVRFDDGTAISECLVPDQPAGDISRVSQSAVEAANALNAQVREGGSGAAAVQLGYLVGAVQEGAAETGGIHEDLVRRLDSAARSGVAGGPDAVAFERDFGEGYAAAQASG